MPEARHHHYIPQCYLRRFTRNGAKNSKITVIDLKRRSIYETIPRNVGGIRDFNRINVPDQAPDALENAFSKFETSLAKHLEIFERDLSFDGNTRIHILNLIALLAIRTPFMRENMRQFRASIAERIMDIELSSKTRWNSTMKKMEEAGEKINKEVTYEQAKEFYERKEYTIEVSNENHIHTEMAGIDTVLPFLFNRKWLTVTATEETGPFVTTDNPVILSWLDPPKTPSRYPPGFGLKGTEVLFPVSKNIALSGIFSGEEKVIRGTSEMVAMINTKIMLNAMHQIYAPMQRFNFRSPLGKIFSGVNAISTFRK